jgi:hypothetical protein
MSLLESLSATYQNLLKGMESYDESLHVEVIPGFEWARLGITQEAVLLLLPPEINNNVPDHDLEHIRISPRQRFNIKMTHDFREEAVSVIATKSRDGWLVDVFLELVAMLFDSGVTSDQNSVRKLIQDLVSLFRALTQPNQKSVQGLWGELFLILQATDTDLAVSSWHTTPNDRYDFAKGHERVEVKTTTGPRIHMFSHTQLVPIEGLKVTIASLILNSTADGVSCADLVSQVLPKLDSEPMRRGFVNQVVRTLGENWNQQGGIRYDIEQANQSLSFYDANNVPKITQEIPPNVHAVKYQSDHQVAREMERSDFSSHDVLSIALYGVA